MRWLGLSVKALLWLLAVLSLCLWGLVTLPLASQWLVKTGVAQVAGLSVTAVQGSIAQGLAVADVRYQQDGLTVTLDEASLQLQWSDLLAGRLTIADLSLHQVNVDLPVSDAAQQSAPFVLPDVILPLAVSVQQARVQQLHLTQNAQPMTDIDSLTLRAHSQGQKLVLDAVTVVMPEPNLLAQLSGEWALDATQSLALDAQVKLDDWDTTATMLLVGQPQDWVAEITDATWLEATADLSSELLLMGDLSHLQVQAGSAQLLGGRLGLSGTQVDWSQGLTAEGKSCVSHLNTQPLGTPALVLNTPIDWQVSQADDALNWRVDLPSLHIDMLDANKHISAQVHAQGDTQAAHHISINATMDKLQAQWQGAVSWQEALTVAGSLSANAEHNQLLLSGQFLPTPNLALALDAPDLSVIAGVSGRVEGKGRLQGSWHTLMSDLHLIGKNLAWQEQKIDNLSADITATQGDGRISLNLTGLPDLGKDSRLNLDVVGRVEQQTITLTAQAQQAQLDLTLTGGWLSAKQAWQGTLRQLRVEHPVAGNWQQGQSVGLFASAKQVTLQQPLCLQREQATACIDAHWLAGGTTQATIKADKLALAWLRPWLPDTLTLAGNAQLNASFQRKSGLNRAQFSLSLPDNVLLLTGHDGISRHAYRDVMAQGQLHGNKLDATLSAQIEPRLKTSAQISVNLAGTPSLKAKGQIALASLAPFSHLSEAVQDLAGSAQVHWQASGRFDALTVAMNLDVSQLALTLPATGVRLHFPSLSMKTQPNGKLAIQGELLAGDGKAQLVGTATLTKLPQWQLDVSLIGQDLLLANMPQATVWLSPDVRLTATQQSARLTGLVLIPKAMIHPQGRASGAVGLSDDVVFVGEQQASTSPYDFHPELTLRLGDEVRIKGAGLTAKLTGELQAQNNRNGQLWLEGELSLQDGKYRAYRQDLTIERGQLVFNGPMDKPGIQLRASRQAGDYEAGVDVSGTLAKAELQVFSRPALSESDALGVLITGQRLQDISGAEAAMLLSALADDSDADPLLSKVGKEVGLDIGLASIKGEQATGVSLGKRLAPDLYVRYVVGAFDYGARLITEYRINRLFSVEMQTGQYSGGDVFYRLETD
jgi:translocation and assembly module TamB